MDQAIFLNNTLFFKRKKFYEVFEYLKGYLSKQLQFYEPRVYSFIRVEVLEGTVEQSFPATNLVNTGGRLETGLIINKLERSNLCFKFLCCNR